MKLFIEISLNFSIESLMYSLTEIADINRVLMNFRRVDTQKLIQTVSGQLFRGLGERKGNTFHPIFEKTKNDTILVHPMCGKE